MIAADYAHAAAYLDRARLPAYVSFIEQATARGIAGDREAPQRIYVRTSDGVIVSGVPPQNVHVVKTNTGGSDNPFGKQPLFDPKCYTPESENPTRWNGRPATRFVLQSTCKADADIGITELYADPQTLRPIAVDGTVKDIDANMTVAIEMDYTTVGAYTVPESIRAHAVGHGWLFWARERAEVDYTNYEFYTQAEFTRRQAAKP
jgi:hypothetical protein